MKSLRALLATVVCSPDTMLLEEEIAALWRYIVPALDGVETTAGKPVRLLKSGRVNSFSGPDLKDVEIEISSRRLRGDLEIHRQSADWYHHGHHRDPAFDGVVVHLCFKADPDCPTRRSDGRFVPVVELYPYLSRLQQIIDLKLGPDFESRLKAVKHPCYGFQTGQNFHQRLNRVALCWFFRQAATLKRLPVSRRLFQPLVEALGYTANHKQFRRLARRLKISEYYRRVNSVHPVADREAWLLGVGGWLEGRLPSGLNRSIRRRYQVWRSDWSGTRARVKKTAWTRRGVRPHSYPRRRWLVMAAATRRLDGKWAGWLNEQKDLLFTDCFRTEMQKKLSKLFHFNSGCYWQHHYGFPDQYRDKIPRPVGKNWFDRLLINVFLPWYYLQSLLDGEAEVRKRVESVFINWPSLPGNRRTRIFKKQLGLPGEKLKTAALQQGAVFLYKQFCRSGDCENCPFSSAPARLFEALA
jgi:hypothetical protein